MTASWKHTLAAALVMGLVAAALVWWLERFETERLHSEVRTYLDKFDKFRAWEAEHDGGS